MAAEDQGEFVLVVGDYHIPTRASAEPAVFKDVTTPGRMKHVLCTGNMTCSSKLEEVKALAPSVAVVRGDYDDDDSLPEETIVVVGGFRIGLCHGHQVSPAGSIHALAQLQRRMDVDVLVTGHTHEQSVVEFEGKLFVNPGSVTGASTTTGEEVVPSFVLFAVKEASINVFSYTAVDGKREVSSAEFKKPVA